MKDISIMITGVGGQGTLLASRLIGAAGKKCGYEVKLSEVHGMSQRGGSVVTAPVVVSADAPAIQSSSRNTAICASFLYIRHPPPLTLMINQSGPVVNRTG